MFDDNRFIERKISMGILVVFLCGILRIWRLYQLFVDKHRHHHQKHMNWKCELDSKLDF